MKKIILLIIPILLLCGCDEEPYDEVGEKYSDLITYCDKEYGVEYIRDEGLRRGGITVRLDENGNVIHCE